MDGHGRRIVQFMLETYFPLDADSYPVAIIAATGFPAMRRQAHLTGYGDLESFKQEGDG